MNKIFAKLKNDQHVIVYENPDPEVLKNIYKIPNVKLAIPFEIDSRSLAENEWYFITPTEERKEEMLSEYVSEGTGTMLDPMHAEHYKEIRVAYMISGEEKFFIKMTSRRVIRAQQYVVFGETPQLIDQGNAISLSGEVDAYWNGTKLFFKKFSLIQSLFPGIKKMYKELTEQETNEFLSSTLFELKEEMSSDFVALSNRKKIASIIDGKVIDLKDTETCEKYLEYAKQYNLDLEIADGKIALIDNSDIGKVISLLGESFYTTEITGERREIRSSRKLVHAKRKRAK